MVTRNWWRRIWTALLVCGVVFGAMWGVAGAQTAAPPHLALLSVINGPIGPATAKQVSEALATAHDRNAAVLILELDTPGGLSSSTRAIISAILASNVPVIGYVAPPGAHAASAGTYILYATSLAAMAPGTNLGAATPIQIGTIPGLPSGGKDGGSTLDHKIVNDAVAQIRALAEMHGRNADWAEKAVREAATLTASQAKAQHVVELIAPDINALLREADGRKVVTAEGTETLHTAGLTVERVEPGFVVEASGRDRQSQYRLHPDAGRRLWPGVGVRQSRHDRARRHRRDLSGAGALCAQSVAARLCGPRAAACSASR